MPAEHQVEAPSGVAAVGREDAGDLAHACSIVQW
jgi:hypothetical protein